jgi:hypothetical protein
MTSTRQPKPPAVELSSGTIRRHVIWGAAITALGGLLFGYDTAVISGAIGFLGTAVQHYELGPIGRASCRERVYLCV